MRRTKTTLTGYTSLFDGRNSRKFAENYMYIDRFRAKINLLSVKYLSIIREKLAAKYAIAREFAINYKNSKNVKNR